MIKLFKEELNARLSAALATRNKAGVVSAINAAHYADIADYINFASPETTAKLLRFAGAALDPRCFLECDISVLGALLKSSIRRQVVHLLDRLEAPDISKRCDDLSPQETEALLKLLSRNKRDAVRALLTYPKDSAGTLMHDKYVAVLEDATVADALKLIAENDQLPKECDEIFVIDSAGAPIGRVHIRSLLRGARQEGVAQIMQSEFGAMSTDLDQEEVAYKFRHYNLSSAPVVNRLGKMVGVITLDQIMHVLNEEAEEDILKSVGVNTADIYSAFFRTAIKRFPWLFFNLLTACMTSLIISLFKHQIEELALLAAILPIVASMGGNAGTQSATIAIRGITNKDITRTNTRSVIFKEIGACAINGALLGGTGAVILYGLYGNFGISCIFALAVMINFVLAGFWGGIIPLTLSKLGLDPAIASGVLLTFLTDLLGFFVFLSLAYYMLI